MCGRTRAFFPPWHLWAAWKAGQFPLRAARRLVAFIGLLLSSCAALVHMRRLSRQSASDRSVVLPAHVLQHVGPPDDDLRLADRDHMLVVQALEADGDPLPGDTEHVGEIRIRE